MLHRSFKAGKCKTSLKLAVARMKLLKNKRETQLRQMKRDLAQLLQSGQEKTAMIRVEHVVREEKMVAAYDLVDIYCELIVARLPIIESQKNCPIDLKEAISSVIFASPRCADVPELLDVRKHFTAKYGKEFITSALEIRPECGVNRTMIEKLSARAPDGQTKIKILTEIAQEHNVKWDAEAFGEKELKPPEDLLSGPIAFESASKMPVEHHNVQLPPTHGQKYESSIYLSQKDLTGPSQSSPAFGTTDTSTPKMTQPTQPNIFRSESRSSENESKGRNFGSSHSNSFSSNRQNWNMEFKDATSAARAAAESAERASIAARAAAELSSYANITRQYSSESHNSPVYDRRDERSSKDSVKMVHNSQKGSSYDINPSSQNQQRERNESENLQGVAGSMHDGYDSIKRRSRQSSMASTDDDILVTGLPNTDRYQKSSSEAEAINPNWHTKKPEKGDFLGDTSFKKQSNQSEVKSVKHQRGKETEKSDHSGDGSIKKQSSKSASSHSHASTDDDDDDVINSNPDLWKYGNDGGEHSFIDTSYGNVPTNQPIFKDSSAVVFDDYVSDKESNFGIEGEFDRREVNSYAPSPVRKSPSPLEVSSKGDDLLPAAFDESDGPISESEDEKENFKLYGRTESSIQSHEESVFTRSPGESGHGSMKSSFTRKESIEAYRDPWLHSSHDDSKSGDVCPERNQETQVNVGSPSTLIDRVHGSMKSSLTEKEATRMDGNPWLHSSPDDSESVVSPSMGNQETKLNVSTKRGATGRNRKPWLNSSSDDSESESAHIKRNEETKLEVGGESLKKYNQGDLPTTKLYPKHSRSPRNSDGLDHEPFYHPEIEEKQQPLQSSRRSSAMEIKAKDDFRALGSPDSEKVSEFSDHMSSETGQELNLKRLTGGFRNKAFVRPPYTRSPSGEGDTSQLSTKKAAEDTPTVIEQPVVSPVVKSSTSIKALYQKPTLKFSEEFSSRKAKTASDSDGDDADLIPRQTIGSRVYKGENLKIPKEFSSSKGRTIFDSDSDDAEVTPQQTVRSRAYKGERLSRRTRGSPAEPGASSLLNLASGPKMKLSPQVSYETETSSKPPAQVVSSGSEENKWKKTSTSVERQSFNPTTPQPQVSEQKESVKSKLPKTKRPVERKPSMPTEQPKVSAYESSFKSSQLNSSVEQPFNPPTKSVPSGSTDTTKPSSLRELKSDLKEDSPKKASHVHPKLPDYETFAAHFESLRSNRRSS